MTTRRQLLKTTALAGAALAMPAILGRASATGETLYVADSGGEITKVYRQHLYDPFEATTGIRVEAVVRPAQSVAQMKSMAETRNFIFDAAVGTGMDEAAFLSKSGLIEEYDLPKEAYADLPPATLKIRGFIPDTISAFSTIYRPSVTKKALTSVADIWNMSIPGARSLENDGRDNIEWALRADGVPAGEAIIRELQTEAGWKRAFAKLDEIKPHIATWWTNAPHSAQLLHSGEIDITPTYTNRAATLILQGEQLEIMWKQGYYTVYGWVIPKGNPKAEMVQKLISFSLDPERQAKRMAPAGSGPPSPSAFKFIDEKLAKLLPTYPDNFKQLVALDYQFWGENLTKSKERFNEWLVK